MPDHPYLRFLVRVLLTPAAEQVVDDRVQPLVRWVPRLQQVVVEPDVVDGLDRHACVGVRREQQETRLGRLPAHLLQQLDPGHPRHALVGDDERDCPVLAAPAATAARVPRHRRSCARPGSRRRSAHAGRARSHAIHQDRHRPRRWSASTSGPAPRRRGGVRRGSASAPSATQGWWRDPTAGDKCPCCQGCHESVLSPSSWKTVSWRPAGASRRALRDCHGVITGSAIRSAPPSTSSLGHRVGVGDLEGDAESRRDSAPHLDLRRSWPPVRGWRSRAWRGRRRES